MRYAILNEKKVLTGYSDLRGDVPVIDECDLTPGGYVWDAARRTFMPILKNYTYMFEAGEYVANEALRK